MYNFVKISDDYKLVAFGDAHTATWFCFVMVELFDHSNNYDVNGVPILETNGFQTLCSAFNTLSSSSGR